MYIAGGKIGWARKLVITWINNISKAKLTVESVENHGKHLTGWDLMAIGPLHQYGVVFQGYGFSISETIGYMAF